MQNIQQIGVIGAGTMGNGIAHTFAQSGYQVVLIDRERALLDRAVQVIEQNLARQVNKGTITQEDATQTLARLQTDTTLGALAGVDFVVEAVFEDLSVKKEIFTELDAICGKDVLLASNTSSFSITVLAACTSRPEQVIGMHFMNPVPVMKLVEVIRGYHTSTAVLERVFTLAKSLGKEPVEVQDSYGFVANRILMPMLNEAIYTLHQGIATVEAIDTVMRLGMAHPMGPLQLADFIGLDVCEAILNIMQRGLAGAHYAPCPLLSNMVAAGDLGRKSQRGFYLYEKGKPVGIAPRFSGA